MKTRGTAPLIAGFVLLGAVLILTLAMFVLLDRDRAEARRAGRLQLGLAAVLTQLTSAETGQRGFLLTGDESYLPPFHTDADRLPSALDGLRDAADEPAVFADRIPELRGLILRKLDELNATVDLRRSGREQEALARVRSGEGKELMDRARTLIGELQGDSDRLLASRLDDVRRRLGVLLACIIVALLSIVVFAVYAVRDAAGRRRTMQDANAKLVAEALVRERLEAQLRQSQKMEAMGQLTGGIAHDFNNLLTIIISSLNLLRRRLQRGDTEVGRFVDYAIEGAERAATLTHRLLTFARRAPLAPAPLDLNRLIPSLSELLGRSLGETVMIETVLGAGLWRCYADANQLESALVNLAVNARDAMPDGGKLTIETANAHLDDEYAARHLDVRAGQYVMLAVSDTGHGMPPEVLAQAFEPFFTTKPVGKGSGLGLSQVFGFVRQSGGHVKAYSEPGQGTTIRIYLPRLHAQAEPARPPEAPPQDDAPAGDPSQVVLVVEDEDRVRRLTVEALRALNYTVIHASGARAALDLLGAHPEIDLLFTDVVMPEVSGRELVDAARLRQPGLRVLYTTGYTRNAIVHNGIVDPDVKLLGKPFTLDQLARKVHEAIRADPA